MATPVWSAHYEAYAAADLGCAGGGTCTFVADPALDLPTYDEYTWYVRSYGPAGYDSESGIDGWTEGPGFTVDEPADARRLRPAARRAQDRPVPGR